jgi:hypothetical protein
LKNDIAVCLEKHNETQEYIKNINDSSKANEYLCNLNSAKKVKRDTSNDPPKVYVMGLDGSGSMTSNDGTT